MAVHNPSLVEVRDEGISQGPATAINFTGAGVSASVSGFVATVTIAGGGGPGGASATTVEVNLGSTATWRGKFTITDAAIDATSKVLCWQAPGPYTGKGTRADEAEIAPVSVIAVEPAAGSAVVKWETPPMLRVSVLPHNMQRILTATFQNHPQSHTMVRLGKVSGNIKFSYMVMS